MTQALTQPTNTDTSHKRIMHVVCRVCYPENIPGMISFCGKSLLGIVPGPDWQLCIVCADLESNGCEVCYGRL